MHHRRPGPTWSWRRALVPALAAGLTTDPTWRQAIPPGAGCLPPHCAAGQLPLALPLVAHDGRLRMIGDGADPTRIYESEDGVRWTAHRHDAGWGARYRAADASFRGSLWRAGGFVESHDRRTLASSPARPGHRATGCGT